MCTHFNSFMCLCAISCKRWQFTKPKWNFLTKWLTIAIFIEHKYVQRVYWRCVCVCVYFQRIFIIRFTKGIFQINNEQNVFFDFFRFYVRLFKLSGCRCSSWCMSTSLTIYFCDYDTCVFSMRIDLRLMFVKQQIGRGKSSKIILLNQLKANLQRDKHAVKLLSFILVR